jgi:alpha-tubulin suppressor-like RCC1 family protein
MFIGAAAMLGVACSSGAPAAKVRPGDRLPMPSASRALLAAGFSHSLGPDANGRLLAWGDNRSGQLGDGSAQERNRPVPVALPSSAHKAVAVAAGSTHSLALAADGSVWAWGHNQSGQLGDGSKTDRPSPKRVSGVHDVRAVAAGAGFSLVLEADGTVLAWGNNQSGQLGDGNAPIDHASPEKVYGLGPGSTVTAIAAGSSFGLVLKRDGSVFGWGNGTSGQIGDGAATKRSAPTAVVGLGAGSGVVQIAAGGSFAMALKRDGSVWAWGNNASGQLGDGTAPTDHRVPVPVKGLGSGSRVVQVTGGNSFALALKSDGTVFAWGNNESGELGDGSAPTDHHTPVRVPDLDASNPVIGISAGGSHSLALRRDGAVLAWGNNSHGQLGDGTAPTDQHTPVAVLPAGSKP